MQPVSRHRKHCEKTCRIRGLLIPKRAMEMLTNWSWKGNIRELANFIERAVILTRGEELEMPLAELATCSETNVAVGTTSTFRQAESSVIIEALRAASGRIAGRGEPPNG